MQQKSYLKSFMTCGNKKPYNSKKGLQVYLSQYDLLPVPSMEGLKES